MIPIKRHSGMHAQFDRFLRSLSGEKKRKGKGKLTMMKSFDFECDTCGKVFEQIITEDLHQIPCTAKACTGRAERKLGGHPTRASSSNSSAPNMGGYACHNELIAVGPMTETKIGDQTVKVGLGLIEHVHKPKTSA